MAGGGYFGWLGSLFGVGGRARRPLWHRFGWRGVFGRRSDDRLPQQHIRAPAVARPQGPTPAARARGKLTPHTLDRVKRMRRRAVIDMFDQVGLGPFPGQLWRFIDAEPDPFAGVMLFLEAVGVDAAAVRRRDAGEIERANTVLELLFSIDHVFDRVAPEVAAGLEARLCSGDYAAVHRAAEVIQTFEAIARLAARWPAEGRLAVLDHFLREMRAGAADPLAVPPHQAVHAARAARELSEHMVQFDSARDERRWLLDALRRHWRGDWGHGAEATARDAALATAAAAEAELLHNPALHREQVSALIAQLATVNQRLRGVADRIGVRLAREAGTAPLSEIHRAMAFFGWDADARPDAAALRKRFRELARKMHPDSAEAEAKATAHARFVELNRFHEVLKLAL